VESWLDWHFSRMGFPTLSPPRVSAGRARLPRGMQSERHHFGTVSSALDAYFYPSFSARRHCDCERQAFESRNHIKGALGALHFEALTCVSANQQISTSLL